MAAFTNLDKVDELNSLASHAHDHIHKTIESPKIISTKGEIVPIIGGVKNDDGSISPADTRLNWVVLKTLDGAAVSDLAGALHLAEAQPFIKDLLESFTEDYPELQSPSIIKNHAQISGAALERMLTPAQNRLDASAANYDQQLIKLRQMGIAVGGWRTRNGWTFNSEQQKLFAPFDLDSYHLGELDFNIKRSVLIEATDEELVDTQTKRINNAVAASAIVPQIETLKIAGYNEEQAQELIALKNQETPVPSDAKPNNGLPMNQFND